MANTGKQRRHPAKRHAEIVRGFSKRLRETRALRDWTQQQLAIKAQITVPYVGRLERGEVAPGIDMLARLAQALNVCPADLLPATDGLALAELRMAAQSSLRAIVEKADVPTFSILNPLLTMIERTLRQ